MIGKLGLQDRSLLIRTPDQRLRIFVSSTLKELAAERDSVRQAILKLRLSPVMFESGARPHPAQELYQAYLSQSHIFIGIYWQSYGWIAPGMDISGLEDEYNLSSNLPRLIYIKSPAADRDPDLTNLLARIRDENSQSYKSFSSPDELKEFVENDLIILLSEYFETVRGDAQFEDDLSNRPFTNLPIPRNPLIGRENELIAAHDLLIKQDVGLVTLTGPGGAGKSRLGIQIALEIRDHFADGVYLVALESISDAKLVIPTVAKTLGITETTGSFQLLEYLKETLCNKEMLLLLDNFEQVLEAGPKIGELLEACPRVKIIITSRAALHLRPEKVLPVPPLEVPPIEAGSDLHPLSQYSAVQLFIQRAQSVKPDFQVTNDNAPAVAEICYRLDGLPLAIELAAARIAILPPQALLTRLEHRFDVLRGGTRDLPQRQRTLYSAIDWSYSLLRDEERELLRSLSVFAGGWTLEAANMVCLCDDESSDEILNGLEILIDNNLLKPPVDGEGEIRFSMLETIREYAEEQLALIREEETEVQRRHADYYLQMTESAAIELRDRSQSGWLDRLEREHDNFRAALNRSLEAGNLETAMRYCASLWRFWSARSHVSEGRSWFNRTFSKLADSGVERLPDEVLSASFTGAGALARIQGDLVQARTYHQKSLDLRRQTGDIKAISGSLNNLALVSMFAGNYEEAHTLLEESLLLARESKDDTGIVFALNNLGIVEMYLLNFERALQLHEETLDIYRKRGDKHGIAGSLGNMGDVLRYQGKLVRAQRVLLESLELMTKIGDKQGMAITLASLGRVALNKKNGKECEKYYLRSLKLLREVDDRTAIADAFEGLAAASWLRAQKKGDKTADDGYLRAVKLCAAAEELRESTGAPLPPTDRDTYDRTLAALKDRVDEVTFQHAWNMGQDMRLEQAIEFALDGK